MLLVRDIQSSDLTGYASNANGRYWKFPDGTLICASTKSYVLGIQKAWGSLYESDMVDLGDLPYPFISTPHISATSVGTASFVEYIGRSTSTKWGYTFFCRPLAMDTSDFALSLIAVGRWK